jgi:hypothetical protein
VRQDDVTGRVAGREGRLSAMGAELCGDGRVGHAHAGVDLQGVKAEIEQDRVAILRAQRIGVGAKLGQHRTAAHGAALGRQADGDPRAPAFPGGGLECEQADAGLRGDADAASIRHR